MLLNTRPNEHFIGNIMFPKSRQVSQLFGKDPRDVRQAIKEEKAVQLQK